MSRVELKNAAKEQIRGNIWLLFAMTLVIAGITFVCGLIPFIGWIASIILSSIFTLSLSMIYLSLIKNQSISIGDVFNGFNNAGNAIILNILIGVFTFLWSLLLIIPGIIKAYSYSMSMYILADHPELTASQAIAKSQAMMQGHKFDLFVLQLSFIGWSLLVSITFGLAAIYVIPYMNATMANFYNSIKDSTVEV